jgi:hypothetical protein
VDEREKFVRDLYLGVLKRPGEQEGLRNALSALGEAPTFGRAAELLSAFVNGAEARDCRLWRGSPPPPQESVRNALSVGTHCLTSNTLKKFGLKRRSGPFDWIFSSIPMAAHCLDDDFSTFLDERYFEPVHESARTAQGANFCHHTFYRDRFCVHHVFNHYDASQPEGYAYYQRCVARFLETLNSAQRNLLVAVTETVSDEEFDALRRAVEKYKTSELLVIRAVRCDYSRFGAELTLQQGPHRLFNLYMTGALGAVEFIDPADEVTFRRLLDAYAFDLA